MELSIISNELPLVLKRAILLYENQRAGPRNGQQAFASLHTVAQGAEGPTIEPGVPLTKAALQQALTSLNPSAAKGLELIHERLLISSKHVQCWWRPAQLTTVFFNNKEIGVTSGKTPQPALIFVRKGNELRVFACVTTQRPDRNTRLYFAPYMNIWSSHTLCMGNLSAPRGEMAHKIEVWEDLFFNSTFTHPNHAKPCKGNVFKLWQDLLAGKYRTFPKKVLIETNLTLGDILKGK